MYYYNYPRYYHQANYYNQPRPTNQFPPVDSKYLNESAIESKKLMEEASVILDKLADSKEFGAKLMYAAQASDIEEVKRLINSIEINSEVEVNYNPDGLRLEFRSKNTQLDCCRLLIALRWR